MLNVWNSALILGMIFAISFGLAAGSGKDDGSEETIKMDIREKGKYGLQGMTGDMAFPNKTTREDVIDRFKSGDCKDMKDSKGRKVGDCIKNVSIMWNQNAPQRGRNPPVIGRKLDIGEEVPFKDVSRIVLHLD
ncbi:hypothetical protein DdX_18165 [Ditylenchus destructor]|uniref:Uncharacterized protein n=1 Tax=Ditylenchus destructor TaxID=166010 RepID=A0AAD4QYC5_9BILA|nr:hypothetical protein DdX_18165 [Ditylenchus destructor]